MSPTPKKKVLTPHGRFFLWYCVSLLVLGPLGFIVGPLAARALTKRVERRYPIEAAAARARDVGINAGQWWALTLVTLLGVVWIVTLGPALFFVGYGLLAG